MFGSRWDPSFLSDIGSGARGEFGMELDGGLLDTRHGRASPYLRLARNLLTSMPQANSIVYHGHEYKSGDTVFWYCPETRSLHVKDRIREGEDAVVIEEKEIRGNRGGLEGTRGD